MNEIFVSIEDLKTLFHRLRYRLKNAAIFSAVAVLTFCLLKEPVYIAEATFHQSSGHVEQSIDLKNFVKTMMTADAESSTVSLMFSQKVLRRVVEKLGLQAEAFAAKPWKILDNLRIESHLPIGDAEAFRFSDVTYNKEESLSLDFCFLSSDTYQVFNKEGELLAHGKLGQQIRDQDFTFTLAAAPHHFRLGKKYPLTFTPWRSAVSAAKKRLSIKPTKLDHNVLALNFAHRDPLLAAQFLNELMACYQAHLKEENEMLAAVQLKFLSKRQEDVALELEKTLQHHVSYLKGNIGRKGYIEFEQGATSLQHPHEEYTSKLFNVEHELARLEKTELEQIAAGKLKIAEASELLHCLEKGGPLPALKTTLASLVQDIHRAETGEQSQKTKQHLASHLKTMLQSMQKHQDTLSQPPQADMRGIDLATAKELYLHYSNELDALRVNMLQIQFFLSHLKEPDLELSSLCRILTDSITQDMVQKASSLELQLQDELTHSGKEHERVKEALATQKKFIARHLSQTIELEKIHVDMIQEKLFTLQKTMIDLLKNEKKLIEEKLASIRENMTDLPEKWRLENSLKFKTELTQSMMEGLSQFSESKNLSSLLYQVESRPLDKAYPPTAPRKPHILFLTALGAFFGALFFYVAFLLRGLIQGLPISLNQLKILGLSSCGEIGLKENEVAESDLETLRKMTSFVLRQKQPSVIALLIGKNPNISQNLAQLLSLRSCKVLIVECDFTAITTKEETPGLWQFLVGEISTLPLHKMGEYDLIKTGKSSSQGTELLSHERFSLALSTLKLDYDYTLLLSRAPFLSTETAALLQHADCAAAFFADETLEEIEPLQEWSRQKENSSLTFVKCEAPVL